MLKELKRRKRYWFENDGMKIVDWRLIRVLMIEVNMITYEWNRDDLKENENMKDEVDMNWLFVWRRVFEIVNWYWLNRCNDIESIEIEYENDWIWWLNRMNMNRRWNDIRMSRMTMK